MSDAAAEKVGNVEAAETRVADQTPADRLADEMFRALSNDKRDKNGNSGPTKDGGDDRTRAALKELILAVQGKLSDKLAPPPVRRAERGSPPAAAFAGGSKARDSCVFLKVTVVEGRALVGELVDERTTSSALYNFAVDLQFNSQRARTRNDVRCCVEPDFGLESFVFVLREAHELPVTAGAWASFLQSDLPLHVALTKHKVSREIRPQAKVVPKLDLRTEIRAEHDEDRSGPLLATKEVGEDDEEEDQEDLSVHALPSVLDSTGKRGELVGTAEVDWRRALVPVSGVQAVPDKKGGVLLAVELASAAPDSIVHPVGGILHLRLEVVAPPTVSAFPFKADDVRRIMDLQVSVRSEARRDFYLYANEWWKGFTSTSKELSKRSIKIFAEDERGQHRCVCCFLEPYRQGRMLPTPRHAARFVSLLPFRPRHSVGEQQRAQQVWNSPHAFLAAGRGDTSDHALLLCSLLLGYGLDAFVCCGLAHPNSDDTNVPGAGGEDGGNGNWKRSGRGEETGHMWVCTFSGPRANQKAVFWESLTGQRFPMAALRPRLQKARKATAKVPVTPRHLSKVSCMFSHREFFANKQADNRVGHTSLDISDTKLWKPMDSTRIVSPGTSYSPSAGPASVVLLRPALNTESIAEEVEVTLKRRIAGWRERKGWSTVWDDELGFVLGPAVFAYEQERVCGASFGGDDFQDAVQLCVPQRHCFKGYPTCFDHASCSKMMGTLLTRTVALDILSSTADHLRFALRSSVFAYPDGVRAVWLMLACRFEAPTSG